MQRQCNGAIFHACAMKGSAAYGKKSAEIMKIHILALLVPGASSQAQLGDINPPSTNGTFSSSKKIKFSPIFKV
jgi:hypothetical protein